MPLPLRGRGIPPGFFLFSVKLEARDRAIHPNGFDAEFHDGSDANLWKRLVGITLILAGNGFVTSENLHFPNEKSISIALAGNPLEFLHRVNGKDNALDAYSV